jgi:hypothetical protein
MRRQSFIAFAAVTLVLLIAAVWTVVDQRGTSAVPTAGARVFPDLAANVNKAAEIDIANFKNSWTLKRTGESWALVEKENYPVPLERVKDLLVAMTELKQLEPKTQDPTRYDRLAVEDIGPKESEAVRVTVKDEQGKTLAAGIIGKHNDTLYGKAGGGTYVRRVGDTQTWLAEGVVRVGVTHKDWIDKIIVSLTKKDVAEVRMTHPDAKEDLTASKKDPDAKFLELDKRPAGKKLKKEAEINEIVEIMDGLDLDDVKKASDIQWPQPGDHFEFTTFDGLVVRGQIISPKQYEYWIKLEADVAKEGKDLDKARAEAAKINARVSGWAYQIAAGYGEKLSKKLSEVTEDENKKSGS